MTFLGHRHSPEAKRKIADAMRGNSYGTAYNRASKNKAKAAARLKGKPGRATGWCKPGLEATAHPTSLDIAWAAGVFEGEGWSSSIKKIYPTTHAFVGQKDRWLLDQLKRLFGGGITKRTFKLGHIARYPGREYAPQFIWGIHGTRARGFLMTVYKFLSPRRREQIRTVLTRS